MQIDIRSSSCPANIQRGQTGWLNIKMSWKAWQLY